MSAKAPSDPVIDEVREVRSRISAEFGDDPTKLIEHYIKLQQQHAERLIKAPNDHCGRLRMTPPEHRPYRFSSPGSKNVVVR